MNKNDIKKVDHKIKQISNIIKINEQDLAISFVEKINTTYYKIPKIQINWKRLFILLVNWLALIIVYITSPIWSSIMALYCIPINIMDEWQLRDDRVIDRLKTGTRFWCRS